MKTAQLLLGLAVSAGFLWWSVHDMLKDPNAWPQVVDAFRRANYWLLIPSWAALFVFYWLKAWRWRLLLAPLGVFRPLRDLFPPILIGFAFNNLLPAHLGEFVRILVFSRQHRVLKTPVLSTVVLERVFDILAIVAFLACGLFFVQGLEPSIRKSTWVFGVAALAIALGALAFVTWTTPFVRLFERLLRFVPLVPDSLKSKICGMLESAASGLTSLHNPVLLSGIVLTSLAQWALNGLLIHLALISFGIHVSLWVSCIVLGVVAFGVTIPSSPGYFGVIQFCFMSVLKLFTGDQEAVFAASIFYHLAQYIPVTIVGLIFFNRTGLKMAQVHEAAERDEPAEVASPGNHLSSSRTTAAPDSAG